VVLPVSGRWAVSLHPAPNRHVVGLQAALDQEFFDIPYDKQNRKYQPTAMRMTSGSLCRHLKITGRVINLRLYQLLLSQLQRFYFVCIQNFPKVVVGREGSRLARTAPGTI
jgi:hypothetical protein